MTELPRSSGCWRRDPGNRRMAQVRLHRLQMIEFFEQSGPIVIVSLGGNGSAKIVVERENIAPEILRHFGVAAPQPVE